MEESGIRTLMMMKRNSGNNSSTAHSTNSVSSHQNTNSQAQNPNQYQATPQTSQIQIPVLPNELNENFQSTPTQSQLILQQAINHHQQSQQQLNQSQTFNSTRLPNGQYLLNNLNSKNLNIDADNCQIISHSHNNLNYIKGGNFGSLYGSGRPI